MDRSTTRWWTAPLIAGAIVLLASGCGTSEEESQPVPDASAFDAGQFDELPQVPGSNEAGTVSRTAQATTQTFETNSYGPEQVMDFYLEELARSGWEVAEKPTESQTGIWRGDWLRDGRRLEVIAQPNADGDLREPDQLWSSYSLVLNTDAANNPVYTGSTPP